MTVIDGTPCDVESHDVCVEGTCMVRPDEQCFLSAHG